MVYLIDSENCETIEGIEEENEIIYFYSQKTQQHYEKIKEKFKNIKGIKCENGGKDAMDIEIAFYLGKHSNKKEKYAIVSDDKGYDSMIKNAKKQGYSIERMTKKDIENLNTPKFPKESEDLINYLIALRSGKETTLDNQRAIKSLSIYLGKIFEIPHKKISEKLRQKKPNYEIYKELKEMLPENQRKSLEHLWPILIEPVLTQKPR